MNIAGVSSQQFKQLNIAGVSSKQFKQMNIAGVSSQQLKQINIIAGVSCTCTWPASLQGTWFTSEHKNWTFDTTANTLTLEFATYGIQTFHCYDSDGYRYLAR